MCSLFHQNLCCSNPCLNNGKCLMGYTDKRYLCVCQAGYTGENCGKGKSKLGHCTINLVFINRFFENHIALLPRYRRMQYRQP